MLFLEILLHKKRRLEIFKKKFPSVSTGKYKLVTLVKMGLADFEIISTMATDFTKR